MTDVVLQKFVLLVASGASVWFVCVAILMTVRKYNQWIKMRRGRRLVEFARNLGPILYYSKVDVFEAVCRVIDFKTALKTQVDPKPWEPPEQVWVRPTFVFCNDVALRTQMHVACSLNWLRLIPEEIIRDFTGLKRSDVDKDSFETAIGMIMQRNNRLFVPFCKGLSAERGQWQVNFYGSTPSLCEVRKYLVS